MLRRHHGAYVADTGGTNIGIEVVRMKVLNRATRVEVLPREYFPHNPCHIQCVEAGLRENPRPLTQSQGWEQPTLQQSP
jgi:hypothetical protein